jgi:hypothetical protein
MKKISKILFLFMAVSLFTVAKSNAQVNIGLTIGARPVRPRGYEVRPFRPSPRHVWVAEEWTPNGGNYVYRPGYWALPPHPGAIWIAGHWRHHRGYIWIAGHWS